jgi:putative PIN family toxin of toxin-antitoxin system
VLDANVFVSAALGVIRGLTEAESPSIRIFCAMRDGRVMSLMTTLVLYEVSEKLQTPRLRLPIDFSIDFVDVVATLSEFVPIRGLDMGCRDEDDDRLVETAINGRASVLVTRDKICSRMNTSSASWGSGVAQSTPSTNSRCC